MMVEYCVATGSAWRRFAMRRTARLRQDIAAWTSLVSAQISTATDLADGFIGCVVDGPESVCGKTFLPDARLLPLTGLSFAVGIRAPP